MNFRRSLSGAGAIFHSVVGENDDVLMSWTDSALTAGKFVAGGCLLAIPWASNWQKIDWHFTWNRSSQKNLFNGAASIIAAIFYTGATFQPPQNWMVAWPLWLGALICTLFVGLYVLLLYKYKRRVTDGNVLWPLVLGLVLYISMWCIVALFSRRAFIFQDYHIDGGYLCVDDRPQPNLPFELLDEHRSSLFENRADASGHFLCIRNREKPSKSSVPRRAAYLIAQIPCVGSQELPISAEGITDAKYNFSSSSH
jgi:hypothetical protein